MTNENRSYKEIEVFTVDCAWNSPVCTDTKCKSTIAKHCEEELCMESKIKFPFTSLSVFILICCRVLYDRAWLRG